MRETVLPRSKERGLKKDGFLDHAFLGCKNSQEVPFIYGLKSVVFWLFFA